MPDLSPVFVELRKLLVPYAEKLVATRSDDQELYVDTQHIQKNKKPLFFGAVQLKKSPDSRRVSAGSRYELVESYGGIP